jgi:multicomponent Na+:H+ antiporter subunit E
MIIQRVLLSVPFALAWVLLTGMPTLESFFVGLFVSFLILLLVFPNLKPRASKELRLLERIVAAVQYTLILFRDIYLSAMDVARRVVDPNLPMKPGIILVSTDYTPASDENDISELVAAISAHGITITPGELVIGFAGRDKMYVHCLDVDASSANAPGNQAKRVALLRKIFG